MGKKFTAGWTPAEDQILRDVYTAHGVKVAARSLPDRTLGAIYRRATTIGLKRVFVAAPPRRKRGAWVSHDPSVRNEARGQSVEEWLANGGVIERPEPRPFLRITPSAIKAHPAVSPMRVIGRAA